MHTISNFGSMIKKKDIERENIAKLTEEFLKWKRNRIEVLPPCAPPSIPEPAKITTKCKASKRKPKQKKGYITNKAETRPKPDVKYSEKNAALLDGVRFGKLVALYALEERAPDRQKIWHCVCDCGGTINLRTVQLTKNSREYCDECNGAEIKTFAEVIERQKEREAATA